MKKLKKSSFLKGAYIATLGIVISKLLGILYVIPFHEIIGDSGGALYSYAYTIYLLFISISTAGIPLAISNLVSEYNTLGNYKVKERVFYLGKKITFIFGIFSFVFIMLFAKIFAKLIIGDLTGGNTIEDVAFVIRVISTAILIVPVLSVYRGYFEGHRFMEPPSISQVLEQIVRVLVILVGSFLALKVFRLSIKSAVGIAVFGATVGAVVGYIYLLKKKYNNKRKFKYTSSNLIPVSDKELTRKIIYYAFPLIMIDVCKSMYGFVDTFTVVSSLVKYSNFSVKDAEVILSMLSTWAVKFNMIISCVSTGIVVSLIPNLTKSIVSNDIEDVKVKINKSLESCLFLMMPMTLGITILSQPLWNLFYGNSIYGSHLLGYFIFTGLFSGIFTILVTILQVFKDNKCLFISLIMGVLVKVLFNTNFIMAFYKMGLPGYYGSITATIVGYLTSIIIAFIYLSLIKKINFEDFLRNLIDILCGSVLMTIILALMSKFVLSVISTNRFVNILIISLYTIVGAVIYFLYSYKVGLIQKIFGKKIFKNKKSN